MNNTSTISNNNLNGDIFSSRFLGICDLREDHTKVFEPFSLLAITIAVSSFFKLKHTSLVTDY